MPIDICQSISVYAMMVSTMMEIIIVWVVTLNAKNAI